MRRRTWAASLVVLFLAGTCAVATGRAAPDRLDRFRELARSRLGLAELVDPENPAEAYRDIYALLDEEIVESLTSGGVFASLEFLQDRIDAFGEAWGGAHIRLARVGRLLVGAFRLTEGSTGNSVRVYGPLREESALLATLYRDGRPTLHSLPPGADGPQFIAAWEGSLSGRGTRELRIDLLRAHADGVRVAWTTASLFPDGLYARAYVVRPPEIRIRYELHYPGWIPGCEGQTEQEDVYRVVPGPAAVTRVGRQQHNPWHRELHAAVSNLFAALAAGDESAIASLVPDRDLRARLPALAADPACDAADGTRESVSIAATGPERRPWSLTFRRAGVRWRLTGASVVSPP
ncbi:MAG TPA: hypothetical protein VFQ62_01145 [Methylomirabilota bacterium]|nr:hypothetical protein [Methylomirabilota bacterium]